MWNQPVSAPGGPTPPHAQDAAGLPSLKVPLVMTIAGAVTLAVGVCLFIAALRITPTVLPQNDVAVKHDGTAVVLVLLKDAEYGLYSSDTGISCEVFDPADKTLDVHPSRAKRRDGHPQVLGFRSTTAGSYTVSCDGNDKIIINRALLSPERTRGDAMLRASFLFGALGLITTAASAIWLALRRRRRARVVMSRLLGSPPPGVPAPYASPGSAPGYVPAPYAAYGPNGMVQPTAPAMPTTASSPQQSAPPQGGYGLAPQQVVYRPLPPPDGGQGA
ncbi:hypothetical protein [Actinomyces qiguomingii]|uniref:hypothetical protein n=1 Tax=Actinomyces qiguomingii TaxID=2057800 RepID=UPI000FFF1B71|nr:hypothetical protein [Actinomyces qiguomingii]